MTKTSRGNYSRGPSAEPCSTELASHTLCAQVLGDYWYLVHKIVDLVNTQEMDRHVPYGYHVPLDVFVLCIGYDTRPSRIQAVPYGISAIHPEILV